MILAMLQSADAQVPPLRVHHWTPAAVGLTGVWHQRGEVTALEARRVCQPVMDHDESSKRAINTINKAKDYNCWVRHLLLPAVIHAHMHTTGSLALMHMTMHHQVVTALPGITMTAHDNSHSQNPT